MGSPLRFRRSLRATFTGAATGAALLLGTELAADLPVERTVDGGRTVTVYGADPRPTGAIDFSASGSAARRYGPWTVETDAFDDADRVILYQDGSRRGESVLRDYQRMLEPRCISKGNLTVCQ